MARKGVHRPFKGRRTRTHTRARGRVCGLRRRGRRLTRTQRGAGLSVTSAHAKPDAMIPTMEQVAKPPNFIFSVTWPEAGLRATGEGLPPAAQDAVTSEPVVSWSPAVHGALYTLMVWDPDAPPTARAYLHWLVTNIAGDTPTKGTTLMPWAPPTPPAGTGTHRYIFGLFQQTYELSVRVVDRPLFNPKRFAELHGLHPVDLQRITVQADRLAPRRS